MDKPEHNPLDDLENRFGNKPKETPKPAQKPAEKKVEPAKEPEDKGEKPAEQKQGDKPAEVPKGKPTPWQVAREKEKLAEKYEKEARELRTKLETYEKNPPKPSEDPERTRLAQEREELSRKLAEYEQEIKFSNFERSQEYIAQYQKPFEETASRAVAATAGLTAIDEKSGEARAATPEDFWLIANIVNEEKALAKAEELFGSPSKAAYVMQWRDQVRGAHQRAEAAKAEYRQKGAEREKQLLEQQSAIAKQQAEEFKRHNEEASTKFPQFFKEREGDADWNTKLKTGYEFVDSVFGGKGNPKAHSDIRMKAGSWDALAHDHQRQAQMIKDLEAKIAEYEASEPGEGAPPAATDAPKEYNRDSAFDSWFKDKVK
jgi:hypothetical protein